MNEDRSWVAPLAFCTFGGIVIVAVFLFLKLEGILLTSRGTALVAWLTLIMTACALFAAASAVYIALLQKNTAIEQLNRAMSEQINSELRHMHELTTILLETKYNCKYAIELLEDGKLTRNKYEIFNKKLVEDVRRTTLIVKVLGGNIREIYQNIWNILQSAGKILDYIGDREVKGEITEEKIEYLKGIFRNIEEEYRESYEILAKIESDIKKY